MQRNTVNIGDARELAEQLAPQSVQCIVTSPPYFGLRDYGTGTWEGGGEDCDHAVRTPSTVAKQRASSGLDGSKETVGHQREGFRAACPRCGAVRLDRQMGMESTPDEFAAALVALFAALRPALHPTGSVWIVLGDSYGKKGQLQGIPWLVAFALQADGWILRSDVIWEKKNCMPESVQNRPTRSHEHIFLLSKKPTYYYDAAAIAEQGIKGDAGAGSRNYRPGTDGNQRKYAGQSEIFDRVTRNKRDVWTQATSPTNIAHFATFPPDLIRPCIRAGTSEYGACAACGAPWRRVVEREGATANEAAIRHMESQGVGRQKGNLYQPHGAGFYATSMTTGWQPSCQCGTTERRPCVVLDPFVGSGTTCQVAYEEGRDFLGFDLDPRAIGWTEGRLAKAQRRMIYSGGM